MTVAENSGPRPLGFRESGVLPMHSVRVPQSESAAMTSALAEVEGLLQLKVYENLDDLSELEPLWNDLVADYHAASIFCTWEWLVTWWRHFGGQRQLLVLALFNSSSQLLGLAPFSILSEPFFGGICLRVIRLMGDGSDDSDNLDLPASRFRADSDGSRTLVDWRFSRMLQIGRFRPDRPPQPSVPAPIDPKYRVEYTEAQRYLPFRSIFPTTDSG